MRLAIVLYGQPRNYENASREILQFARAQTCPVDFFYHCWTLETEKTFVSAQFRQIPQQHLEYSASTPDKLLQLYRPVSYEYEVQTPEVLQNWNWKDTIMYKNATSEKRSKNYTNVCFQMYSRNKARNVLDSYVKTSGTDYTFVLTTRFDIGSMPRSANNTYLDVLSLERKPYLSDILRPRLAIPDNCILAPLDVYLQWFQFDDIAFLNDLRIKRLMEQHHEVYDINAEEVLAAKFLYHYTFNFNYFKGGLLNK